MQLFTIGFTRSSAEAFFGRLQRAGVRRVIDVRLNNRSQLAGFAKRDDLAWFLRALGGIAYQHDAGLAPTPALLAADRDGSLDWTGYAAAFEALLRARAIEQLPRDRFDQACLLCSEATPAHCHRRLVAQYLQARWPDVDVTHL